MHDVGVVDPHAAGRDAVVAELAARAPAGFTVMPQRGVDLGARMEAAAAEAAARVSGPVLLRGSDSPNLPFECVAAVADALAGADLAVAPADDGGYDLVGLARPVAGVFSHPMSTGSVRRDTLAAARGLGLRVRELGPEWHTFDLDTAPDLARLAGLRASRPTLRCRNTFAYLDDHALWDLATGEGSDTGPR